MAEERKNKETSLSEFLVKNKTVILTVLAVVILGLAGYVICTNVIGSSVQKKLNQIEIIEYSYTNNAASLNASELAERQRTALSNIDPYLSMGGIAGVRANMFAADIYFAQEKFDESKKCWLNAASKGKKNTYIVSLCNFNAAACAEELGDSKEALSLYESVAKDENFPARNRAYFNSSRIKEANGDIEGAKLDAEAVSTLGNGTDTWTSLAKTKLLKMKLDGKIE